MDNHETTAQLEDILSCFHRNPAFRGILGKILERVQTENQEADLLAYIEALPETRTIPQSPYIYLNILVEHGALRCDQTETQDEEAPRYYLTDAGSIALEALTPSTMLAELFAEKFRYKPLLLDLLHHCETPRSLTELTQRFDTREELQEPRLFTSTLITWLEQSGGLAWNNGWAITPEGKEHLATN